MTHPIVEGLTEAVTMARLMRENEELRAHAENEASIADGYRRQLAEEKALCDRLYNSKQYGQHDPHSDDAYRKARGL